MKNDNYSNLNMGQIRDQQRDEFDKKVDELDGNFPPANIIVAGKTGVGKSTLLNAIFKEKLAETDIGHPVTAESKKYEKESIPIRIWDTVGFELDETGSQHKKVMADIRKIIADKNTNEDSFDKIHCIWYCINAEAKRFELIESKFVTDLYKIGVPFVVVMTQCFSKKQNDKFQSFIEEKLRETGGDNIRVIQVLALEKEIEFEDEVRVVPAKGLKELVDFTIDSMPEFLKNSFIAAQKVDQDIKRRAGADIIYNYVKAAKLDKFGDDLRKNIEIVFKNAKRTLPILRLFSTNEDAKDMLKRIANLYNIRILKDKNIDDICHDSIEAVEKGELQYFWKFSWKIEEEFNNLISKMNFNKDDLYDNLEGKNDNRSAYLLALYGFKFMNAVEIVWETTTQEELDNIDIVVKKLTDEMNKKYN